MNKSETFQNRPEKEIFLEALKKGAPLGQELFDRDPVAARTDWTPSTRQGGSNMRTRLVEVDSSMLEFRRAWADKMFCALLGSWFALGGLAFIIHTATSRDKDRPLSLIAASSLLCLGMALLYELSSRIVFDKTMGCFWKGRKAPLKSDLDTSKKCARLDQIHSIQLLSKYIKAGRVSAYRFELNLVLEDANRVSVFVYRSLAWAREDAKKLSEFLGKPVWDAIEHER